MKIYQDGDTDPFVNLSEEAQMAKSEYGLGCFLVVASCCENFKNKKHLC